MHDQHTKEGRAERPQNPRARDEDTSNRAGKKPQVKEFKNGRRQDKEELKLCFSGMAQQREPRWHLRDIEP